MSGRADGFWLLATVAIMAYSRQGALGFVAAAAVHEAGHFAALKLLGGRLREFKLGAGGALMRPGYGKNAGRAAMVITVAAGPFAGLVAALLFKNVFYEFYRAGITLSLFNILPVCGLDGGELLALLLEGCEKERLVRALAGVAACALLLLVGFFCKGDLPGVLMPLAVLTLILHLLNFSRQ